MLARLCHASTKKARVRTKTMACVWPIVCNWFGTSVPICQMVWRHSSTNPRQRQNNETHVREHQNNGTRMRNKNCKKLSCLLLSSTLICHALSSIKQVINKTIRASKMLSAKWTEQGQLSEVLITDPIVRISHGFAPAHPYQHMHFFLLTNWVRWRKALM